MPARPRTYVETPDGAPGFLDVPSVLRRVGRGPVGARGLDREGARRLFGAMMDGEVDQLELGGLLIALRMKGESLEELEGALAALQHRVQPIAIDPDRPVVSIPSYQGTRHMANLTPLLACLLADSGVQVIVHGVRDDPHRMATCAVMRAMGLAPVASVAEASFSLELGNPAFVPVDVLCPPFSALLGLRDRLGVRHIGHILAKMIDPVDVVEHGIDHSVRLISFAHPAVNRMQHALLARSGARAIVLRGTESEPVASVRRMPRVDWIDRGVVRNLVGADPAWPRSRVALPPAGDAVATAAWIQSALAGEHPVPSSIARQADLILALLTRVPV